MYPVSNAYKKAIQETLRTVQVTGTITLRDSSIIPIEDKDIVQGTLYITEQCVAGEDLEVGNVYAAEMGLAISHKLQDPYTLDGARIALSFGIDVGGGWEYVPLGYYYVTDIKRNHANVSLIGLDSMILFDRPCGNPGPNTPAGFIAHACNIAGVSFGNAIQVASYANASSTFSAPDESVQTCRDLLMWACQLLGAFARVDRQGDLEVVAIGYRDSARSIRKRERFTSEVSDFAVGITKVAMLAGEVEYYSGSDGMTLQLEESPMVAGFTASQMNTLLNNIRNQVKNAVYVPFRTEFIGDPALQPGDFVLVEGSGILGLEEQGDEDTFFLAETMPLDIQQAGAILTMITHSTWHYRRAHELQAVGKSAMVRGIYEQQTKALSSVIALANTAKGIALSAQQSAQLINDAIGGHILIRQDPDSTNEILIMDNPDPTLARKIWRWNMGGLGYSDNVEGADNPARTYNVAIDMEGKIYAEFIRSGVIAAEHVQIGAATTFEEGYDPSKQHPVGMGADTNCTGLWHFDGSLNSHKGVAVEYDGDFVESKWGQGLEVVDSMVGIPTVDIINPEECTVHFLAHNLAQSPNGSVIFDLGDDANNQAIKAGIAADGRLYIEDKKAEFNAKEESKEEFETGVLTNITAGAMQGPAYPAGQVGIELAKYGEDASWFEGPDVFYWFGEAGLSLGTGTLVDVEIFEGKLQLEKIPGAVTSYGSNFATGSYTADSAFSTSVIASNAFDGSTSTHWQSLGSGFPHWIQVDLGAAVTKKARKLRLYTGSNANAMKDFVLQGSNDGSLWTDIYTGIAARSTSWQDFTFINFSSFRYYRLYITSNNGATNYARVSEIQLMEAATETASTFKLSGYREQEYDVSGAIIASESIMAWAADTPAGTALVVQAAISTNGGVSYGNYQNCDSFAAIPGITAGMNLSNIRVKIKFALSSTNNAVSPSLSLSLPVVISAYKPSGAWEKVYDISPVGKADNHHIYWQELLYQDTTIAVKAAVSANGGSSYGPFQACTNGQFIPGITAGMNLSNVRLKIRVELDTDDPVISPAIENLLLYVSENANVSLGVSKTELDDWDVVAIQWKSSRLALVVNGEETAYIENPAMAPALAQYAYIGSSRSGADKINTTIDELRVDQIYQSIERLFAWYLIDAPFYTTEEFAQWPGYLRQETDGIKVYDSNSNLRVLLGSWLREGIRKYGLKIYEGELYSTVIRSGSEDAEDYVQISPPNKIEVFGSNANGQGWRMLTIEAVSDTYSTQTAAITFHNNWSGMKIAGSMYADGDSLGLYCVYGDIILSPSGSGKVLVSGDFTCTGEKAAMQETENYGARSLYATEAPEVLYFDRGAVHLQNGEAIVQLDPIYLECIEPDTEETPWMVWVESYGENGVYVSEVGSNYFKVKERNGGTSGTKIIWKHEAVRKGYAGVRLKEVVN